MEIGRLFKDYNIDLAFGGLPRFGGNALWYLRINHKDRWYDSWLRRGSEVTTFHIKELIPGSHLIIVPHAQWDTWAPLIIEWAVNVKKVRYILLREF